MQLDRPDVIDEVRAAFERYEDALRRNDVAELDRFFWDDDRVVRYGPLDEQYGSAEVAAARRRSTGVHPGRTSRRVTVRAFGADLAMVLLEFVNGGDPVLGRQSQLWLRTGEGWRVANAHVSVVPRAPVSPLSTD